MFEAAGELRQLLTGGTQRRLPAGPQTSGRFLWDNFLVRTRKVSRLPGRLPASSAN